MANSRRRERELARRRYERRRLREQQQRSRRRRRNTILGAGAGTAVVIGLIVWLAIHLSGGSSDQVTAADRVSSSPSASPTASASPVAAPKSCAPIKPNPPAPADPKVPPVTGKAPTTLVVKDLKTGHGAAAKAGDKLTVNYVGVSCSTGTSFDASYGKQPFSFTLGQSQVIQGWDKGLVGMKPGGRRELVIPASLGYGPTGSGPIKPNETLIFVVDLVKVS